MQNKIWDYSNLFLIVIVWTAIFLISGIIYGGFNYFLDDHQILICDDQWTSLYDLVKGEFSRLLLPNHERFRPLYGIFLSLFSHIYGLRPFIWYLSSLIIAIITTWLFYLTGLQIKLGRGESLCFASLSIFGNQASTYARFGTPETTAMLFTAFSFYLASLTSLNGWKRVLTTSGYVLFAVLAALNKEACILMLPGIVMTRIWFYMRDRSCKLGRSFYENKFNVFIALLTFVFLLSCMKLLNISGPVHAGFSLEILSPNSLKILFATLLKRTSLSLALILNLMILYIWKKKEGAVRENFLIYLIMIGLICLPQLILYAKSGIDLHYLFPIVIGISLFTICPLNEIKKDNSWINKFAMLLITAFIVFHIYGTYKYFKNTALVTKTIGEMTDDLQKRVGKNKKVIVFGNLFAHYEKLYAFKMIMNKLQHDPWVYLALIGSNEKYKTDFFIADEKRLNQLKANDMLNTYEGRSLEKLSPLEKSDVQAMVVFSNGGFKKEFGEQTQKLFDLNKYDCKDYPAIDLEIYHLKNNGKK